MSSDSDLPLLPLGNAGIGALVEHPLPLLISYLSCLFEGELRVRTNPVILLLAVLAGWKAVPPNPVLAAGRIELQKQTSTIGDPTPCGTRFFGFYLSVS